jgi:hypothetical protein
VAKEWKDRKIQQALLQPHKPAHKEILREYEREKRKTAVGAKKQDSSDRFKSARPGGKRSLVEPPKNKMGKKLLLDTR